MQDAIERHLRHAPTKVSKSRIKRLRGLSQPQYRLQVGDIRVFYDVTETQVQVLAVVTKGQAHTWLDEQGTREDDAESVAAYERLRSDTVRAFVELRRDLAREATEAGLTEEGIARLLGVARHFPDVYSTRSHPSIDVRCRAPAAEAPGGSTIRCDREIIRSFDECARHVAGLAVSGDGIQAAAE